MLELDQTLEAWHAQSPARVAGAALRLDGKLVWAKCSGLTDELIPHGLRSGGRVCVYSLTKSFTACVILQLAKSGALSLDDSPQRWFPKWRLPEAITLTHLLRHTSGLRDYGRLPAYHDAVRRRPSAPWTDREYLNHTLPDGLLFPPGEGWAYSNIGFLLLRRLIEQTTGEGFAENVRRHVISPLGLNDTFIAGEIADWETCLPGYASELSPEGARVDMRSLYHPDWCAPGVAVSTAEDITLFYHALLAGKLLRERELARMCDMIPVPGDHAPVVKPSSGLGLLAELGGPLDPSYGHGGSGPGYSVEASTFRLDGNRVSLMAFANESGANADSLQRALTGRVQTLMS